MTQIDPYLARCFWTYPTTTTIPAGQPLTFQVIVPPPVPAGASTTGFPLTGSQVSWRLTDTNGAPLVPGTDYLVLDGDLTGQALSVVFKPVANRQVSVVPQLTLFYTITSPVVATSAWPAVTYTLATPASTVVDRVKDMLKDAVCLSAAKTIIEPAETAVLQLLPRSVADIPQVVTSIVNEAPSVEIRGAIPLDSLIEAVMGPITGALGRVLPGSKISLDEATGEVRRLLSEPLAIPVALDVLGKRISTTLAPVGVPEAPVFTATPQETGTFAGMVPVGKWQSSFTISSVTWAVTENGGTSVYQDLSPGVDFLKSFLLKPKLVPLTSSNGALGAPTPITVTATLHVSLPDLLTGTVDIKLPSLTLQRLPLPIPQIGAVFRHAFDDLANAGDQRVYITTDSAAAAFLPSLDDFTRLLTRLASALNNVVAVANVLSTDWADIVSLASGVSMLANTISRIRSDYVYFQSIWQPGGKITLTGDWDDHISAVIHIGVPGIPYFRLSDGNGPEYIDFGSLEVLSYSCVMPTLGGTFSSLQQIPPRSAIASNPNYDYNDKMEVVGFPTS